MKKGTAKRSRIFLGYLFSSGITQAPNDPAVRGERGGGAQNRCLNVGPNLSNFK